MLLSQCQSLEGRDHLDRGPVIRMVLFSGFINSICLFSRADGAGGHQRLFKVYSLLSLFLLHAF